MNEPVYSDVSHVRPGNTLANLGKVLGIRQVGVFYVFALDCPVWDVNTGKIVFQQAERAFHVSQAVVLVDE